MVSFKAQMAWVGVTSYIGETLKGRVSPNIYEVWSAYHQVQGCLVGAVHKANSHLQTDIVVRGKNAALYYLRSRHSTHYI